MGTRTRWILTAAMFAVAAIILGSAIAQAIRQQSLDPVWMVGWLPAVMVAGMTGRRGSSRGRCLPRLRRLRRPAGS